MKRTLAIIITLGVALSVWLAYYIPAELFNNIISPILFACTVMVAFYGAFLIFRHSEGLRVRKVWGYTLLFWGLIDLVYLVSSLVAPSKVMDMGAASFTTHELLVGNLLGWVLLLYPTEALRPGWMTVKTALYQLLPMFVLVALDYPTTVNLRPLIALYPYALILLLVSHVRPYRIWNEENFSNLEKIDVQWIIHYLWLVILVGCVYFYMCVAQSPTRGFTQLWLTIFVFIYGTEQILFRQDPWILAGGQEEEDEALLPEHDECHHSPEHKALRQKLDEWMDREKPYVNPHFQLADLGEVLPMNRTYLSRFIKTEYECTFYQFVNRHRIEEAKRLKHAHPEMKIEELATLCGFSSHNVFSHVFSREMGMSPHEWFKKSNPA